MKTIGNIAKMCDTSRENVYRAVMRLEIITAKKIGCKSLYDEYQEFLIVENLWHIGKVNYLIFESKMNIPEPEPDYRKMFKEFKERTYGKKQ